MLQPPHAILDILDTLERAGYDTWCVGGAVRDALLGAPNADWDLATAATPQQVMRLFRRTVKLGVEHGTVGVLDRDNRAHEVTTFRRDVQTDGRHAVVEFGASLDEDLARRDFTINAIAYHPRRDVLRDPFGGRDDLARGVVRAVGVAADRMREDRLRALRAFRFAARFEFTIDPALWDAIVASVPDLPRLSAERVSQELEKTMTQVRRPSIALDRWRASGALGVLVPGLAPIDDLTIAALDHVPSKRPEERLAALFWSVDGPTARRAAAALKFSNKRTDWVVALAESWRRLGPDIEQALLSGPVEAVAIRRWVAAIGRLKVYSFWRIAAARWAAARARRAPAPAPTAVRATYKRAIRAAFRDPVEVADLAIDGMDLQRAGIAPGPRMREILEAMLDAVLADPTLNSPDRLLALVARWRPEGRS